MTPAGRHATPSFWPIAPCCQPPGVLSSPRGMSFKSLAGCRREARGDSVIQRWVSATVHVARYFPSQRVFRVSHSHFLVTAALGRWQVSASRSGHEASGGLKGEDPPLWGCEPPSGAPQAEAQGQWHARTQDQMVGPPGSGGRAWGRPGSGRWLAVGTCWGLAPSGGRWGRAQRVNTSPSWRRGDFLAECRPAPCR